MKQPAHAKTRTGKPHVPEQAQLCCAADTEAGSDELQVYATARHSKTYTYYLGISGESEPRYVVKVDARGGVGWKVEREYEGLRFVQKRMADQPGLGAIEPVGYGTDPKFLVTRYQPGQTLHALFRRALRPWANGRFDAALAHARSLAHWLRVFRGAGEPGGGLSPEQYARQCHDKLAELERLGMKRSLTAHVRQRIEGYLAELDDSTIDRLGRSYPTHGDMALQNFIVDAEGRPHAMDLEGFRQAPLDEDFARFRLRMMQQRQRTPLGRGAVCAFWAGFAGAYLTNPAERELALSATVPWLLGMLQRVPRGFAWGRGDQLRRAKFSLLTRSVRRWLEQMPAELAAAGASLERL